MIDPARRDVIIKTYSELGSVRETSRQTGHSRETIQRVVASSLGGSAPAGIDYELLARKVAALMGGGPVNEGPPTATKPTPPLGPGIYRAPRLYRKTFATSDFHFPYHDADAVNAALSHAEAWKPDLFVINGDLYDCYSISRFDKDPARFNDHLQMQFDVAKPTVGRIDALGCDVLYILGNHEAWLHQLIAKNPGLAKLRALGVA
jgi:hypothetical protein